MALMAFLPLARTPQTKEGQRAMTDYSKRVQKMIDSVAPWVKKDELNRRRLRGKVKPGTIVVIPDGTDSPDNPMYSSATIVKG